ncbi:MAG: hypothetical protein JRI95_10680, partial [Deltaproteobacteria bacterium]|nr:hypothetical protein [Deltaproteobacteria bacterium]
MKKIIARLTGLNIRRLIFYELPLDLSLEVPKPKKEVIFREIIKDDLSKFGRLIGEKRIPKMRDRFSQGRLCFGAFDGEVLVNFCWFSLSDEYDIHTETTISVQPGEAYAYH